MVTLTKEEGIRHLVIFFMILLITAISLFLALRRKLPQLLLVPFAAILIYFVVEIILFPAPLFDTLKFILNLR